MKTYEVTISYERMDTVKIEAKSETEAQELVLSGEYQDKDITFTDYPPSETFVHSIKEIK